jgi:hypothetical protein
MLQRIPNQELKEASATFPNCVESSSGKGVELKPSLEVLRLLLRAAFFSMIRTGMRLSPTTILQVFYIEKFLRGK